MGPARTTPLPRDPDRLDEALPWYLNGTLEEADRAWVEQALREEAERAGESAELLRSLEFDRRTAESLEQRLAEIPADVGWAELIRKVREDVAPEPAAARRRDASVRAGGETCRAPERRQAGNFDLSMIPASARRFSGNFLAQNIRACWHSPIA